jgi:hypothetical protein
VEPTAANIAAAAIAIVGCFIDIEACPLFSLLRVDIRSVDPIC